MKEVVWSNVWHRGQLIHIGLTMELSLVSVWPPGFSAIDVMVRH